MSLADCFKKAGKALNKKDADAIVALVDSGVSESDAVAQHLASIDEEITSLVAQVEEKGGVVQRKEAEVLKQPAPTEDKPSRGDLTILDGRHVIRLGAMSDLSTFLHESGHLFLNMEKVFSKKFGVTENQTNLLKWLGVKSFDDITEQHHETFARAFEKYLAEGDAPSNKLRDAFNSFSQWVRQVYRDIKKLDVEIDDDIRQVFDRLLATEVETEAVFSDPVYEQFFKSKEQAGMTDAAWGNYQAQSKRVKTKTQLTLDEKVLKELRARRTKEWAEEKHPLIQEERERIEQQAPYQILIDHKSAGAMDFDAVKEILGVKKIPGKLIGAKKGGVHPEEYAEAYGYSSAKAMLNAVLDAPPLKAAAEAAAEQRMVGKYGDLLNDGSIEEEARLAAHNDEQALLLLQELKALKKLTRSSKVINRTYLKSAAKAHIAKLKYKEIKPAKFYRMEKEAVKRAASLTDPNDIIEAKIQQLANHYLYREATEVKAKMLRHLSHIRKTKNRTYDPKSMHPEYIKKLKLFVNMYDLKSKQGRQEASDAMLDWYLSQVSVTQGDADFDILYGLQLYDLNLLAALKARRDKQRDPSIKQVELLRPTFDDLTSDEMTGAYEMVRHLTHLGREQAESTLEEVTNERQELADSIVEHNPKDSPLAPSGKPVDNKAVRDRKNRTSHLLNSFISLRNLVRTLDGEFKGKGPGQAFEKVYKTALEGANKKLLVKNEMYTLFEKELGGIHKVNLSKKDATDYPLENGGTFSMTSEQRFMTAVYWGIESSRDAIRDGFKITTKDVTSMLSTMPDEQVHLVNSVWKVNEHLWPELSAASIRLTGVAPAKLPVAPFEINGIPMTGGHQTLIYDSADIVLNNEEEQTFHSTNLVSQKANSLFARIGSGGRPVLLDTTNITRTLDDNIHYIAFAEPSRRLQSLVKSQTVQDAIVKKHGLGFYRALRDNLKNLTTNSPARETYPGVASIGRVLRHSATARHLMWSARNTVQQISAVPIAMDEVGVKAWSENFSKYMNPNTHEEFVGFVNNLSPFMLNRASLVNREANSYLNKLTTSSGVSYMWEVFAKNGFTPQTIVDRTIAYPAWMAKYEQGLETHGDVARAVIEADTSVSESVGSGADIHLAGAFQSTNSEWIRTFTLFGSWFNNQLQRMYRETGGFNYIRDAGALRATIVIPFAAAVTSAVAIYDAPGEEENSIAWGLKRYAAYMAGSVPIVNLMVSPFLGYSPKTVFSGGAEVPSRAFNEMSAMYEGRQSALKTASDLTKLVTTVVPVPGVGNLTRAADYTDSFNQGNEGPFFNPLQAVLEGPNRNK